MRFLLPLLWIFCLGVITAFGAPETTEDAQTAFSVQESPVDDASGYDENTTVTEIEPAPKARYLYSSVYSKPERLFKGEVFQVTLRTIVTTEAFETLQYRLDGGQGVELLNPDPERDYRDHAYFDRFYFKVTGKQAVLPDITPFLIFGSGESSESSPLKGVAIDVTVLNPPKDFCGILADRFDVTHVKTTEYDKSHAIVVFMADANRSDLGDFKIRGADKQDFESLHNDPLSSSMTYYAVVPDTLESLEFQYFNLNKKAYERIVIPIEVDDDLVSTISDLKPTDHGHDYQKTVIFASVAALFFLLALWKRSWMMLIIAVTAGGYAAWLSVPMRKICIEQNAPIYLLPMRNAPIFERTPVRYQLEMQGHVKDYTKVRLLNDKIGWVKDEDTCAH